MKHYKVIIISLLIFFAICGVAAANGLFGPPQFGAKDTGWLHTGIGYWHHEDKFDGDGDYLIGQKQLYSEVGYVTNNYWDIYVRVGISDLNIADAFSSTSAASFASKNDFADNMNYFSTFGTKGFYPFGKTCGIGAFIQGTYYFRDFTDDVSGTRNGAPLNIELRIKNLWNVNFGIGLQATAPYGIKLYLGPYVYYSEAKVSPSTNFTGLALASGEMTIKNKTSLGGFSGIEVPLAKGFRLNVEGQYSERLSAGAAVTYAY
ncbi:MAG TPA: hypothetical protein VI728_08185 [Syntrophales bacterium]|nr:hypothetical protein [Syntrophales bacterium]